jgi:5-methylthioadenosine/S-adenosylhomocysteine deaminase
MNGTTLIRNCAWLIAWDGARHVYLEGADVAFRGDAIIHVGADYAGAVDRVIEGSRSLVMPGLINIHSHAATEPINKGFRDEIRSPAFWHSPLYEYLYMIEVDPEGALHAVRVAMGELLLSGVTTAVHLGQLHLGVESDELYDVLAASGMRVYIGPMFRDAQWRTRDGHSVDYIWDTEGGRRDFDRAVQAIRLARSHPSGRLFGMVCPAQIDTCTPDLVRDSFAFAESENLPFQIHASQSPTEFYEMIRREGTSPVETLAKCGALGRRTILGHAIFLDHHPWLHWPTRRDLDVIADSGASVAHCPVEFLRRGMAMRTLGSYMRHGINVGIGTDTYPHNMLEEMRMAAYAARIIGETVDDVTTREVHFAATVGGANALLRNDIGRLCPGARADIVLVDLEHPAMMPAREPLRSLLYVAAERAVRDVFVDGEQVVAGGKPVHIDMEASLVAIAAVQRRGSSGLSERDWAGRVLDELSPMALPRAQIGKPVGRA